MFTLIVLGKKKGYFKLLSVWFIAILRRSGHRVDSRSV